MQQLSKLVPAHSTPILVTDAGFRSPWFSAVSAQGWHWVGRLRGTTFIKPQAVPDHPQQWAASRHLHAMATATPHELPSMLINRSTPLACRLVVYAKARKGRGKANRRTPSRVSRSSSSLLKSGVRVHIHAPDPLFFEEQVRASAKNRGQSALSCTWPVFFMSR